MKYHIKFVNEYINNSIVQSHFKPYEEDFINYIHAYKLMYTRITKGTIFENNFYLKPKILLIYKNLNLPDVCIKNINDYCKDRNKNDHWTLLNKITKRNLAVWYSQIYLNKKPIFGRENFLHPNRNHIKHKKNLKDSLNWYKTSLKKI